MKFHSVTRASERSWRYLVGFGKLRKKHCGLLIQLPANIFPAILKDNHNCFTLVTRQYTSREYTSILLQQGVAEHAGSAQIVFNSIYANMKLAYFNWGLWHYSRSAQVNGNRVTFAAWYHLFPDISLCCSSPLFYYLITEPVLFHIHALLLVASLVNLMLTT